MGAGTPTPIGEAETKAFNVFMKKYIKSHQHQGEDETSWRGSNAWGKLSTAQKKLFAMKPKAYALKRRAPIKKRKPPKPPKPKNKSKVVGRLANPRAKSIANKLAKKLVQKLENRDKFTYSQYRKPRIYLGNEF